MSISIACGPYDRTTAIRDGSVEVKGCDVTYLALSPEEIFHRMIKHEEFDVSEMSFSSYLMTLKRDPSPFVAIPVFPSRSFRLDGIYVRADDDITDPSQLAGSRIGVPEYQISASVWMRGLLEDHYGLAPSAVQHVTGGLEQPGRKEKIALPQLPDGVEVGPAGPEETLNGLLESGGIRALMTARMPTPFRERDGRFRRLFADPSAEGRRLYESARIFPIMHLVVIRRELYERNRWLAVSLLDAFTEAKRRAEREMYESNALRYQLPWLTEEIERTVAIMGEDYWPYGVEKNLPTLEAFLSYHRRQGLSDGFDVADLFAPETTDVAFI